MKPEKKIREILKKYLGDRVFWIEPSLGSTHGLPDAIVINHDDILTPVELKHDSILNGRWKVRLRIPQVSVANRLIKNGQTYHVIVGTSGGDLYLARFDVSDYPIRNGLFSPVSQIGDPRHLLRSLSNSLKKRI